MYAPSSSGPRPGKSSSPVVPMPWRQSTNVPKQSNVNHRVAIGELVTGCSERDGLLRRLVDLLGCQQDCSSCPHRSGGCDDQGKGRRRNVVGYVGDTKNVVLAKGVVERLEL